jgi:hypothetical protein
LSGAEPLLGELLAESLKAWQVAGDVAHADGGVVVSAGGKTIRVEPAPQQDMFRWLVAIDGRQRPAVSLVAVLRQVRQALDPGYAASRVRVTLAPLVPT